MKAVAKQFATGQADQKWRAALAQETIGDDLKTVADAFVTLQQARHGADYDVSRSFTRMETLAFVEAAQSSFDAFERARQTPAGRIFLVALLLQRSVNT